jgi:hypothetical protein
MPKRSHKRFPITGIATLHFEEKGEMKTTQAMLSSISSVGIGLYADMNIEPNKQVSITINFISVGGIKNSVIEGSVVYNKNIGNIHFVGIQFNEAVNGENQPLLYEHIKNILAFDT